MEQPKVSIIVPVYNTEQYLKRCLDSLSGQTLRDIEIILVDDGSPDGAPALCDSFCAADSRIRVIHKENAGLGMARNSGMELARGEYVGFVDSDDYVEADMYESLYRVAKEQDADLILSGISFVGGNMFSESGECEKKIYFPKETLFSDADGRKELLLGVAGALPHEPDDSRYGVSVCKNLFRREIILENGLRFLSEREILSEDALFLADYIRCIKKAVGISGAYYCYCRNGESLSKSYRKDRLEKTLVFLNELEKRLCLIAEEGEYRIYLERLAQGFGRVLCSQEIMHARAEKIPFSVLRKRLCEICNAPAIRNALKTYPWHRLPVKQAVFACLMKYRLYGLQKLMVMLRDR